MSLEARIEVDQPDDREKLHYANVTEHKTESSSETSMHTLIKHRYAFWAWKFIYLKVTYQFNVLFLLHIQRFEINFGLHNKNLYCQYTIKLT